MPVRFAEKQRVSKGVGQWLKPLAVFESVVVGLVMSLLLIKENPDSTWEWVGAIGLVVLAGGILPALLWTMQLRVRVRDRLYSVRLWPTPFKSQVPRRQISEAYSREVDPMRDYGGWGLKGKRSDLLYSLGGKQAVTVEYRRKGQTRKLTVTTERADELLAALSA